MSEAEALLEARRRWGAHGAWVCDSRVSDNGVAYRHAVGIRIPSGSFTALKLLGHGFSWEEAFHVAERAIEKDSERRSAPSKRNLEIVPSGELFPSDRSGHVG